MRKKEAILPAFDWLNGEIAAEHERRNSYGGSASLEESCQLLTPDYVLQLDDDAIVRGRSWMLQFPHLSNAKTALVNFEAEQQRRMADGMAFSRGTAAKALFWSKVSTIAAVIAALASVGALFKS